MPAGGLIYTYTRGNLHWDCAQGAVRARSPGRERHSEKTEPDTPPAPHTDAVHPPLSKEKHSELGASTLPAFKDKCVGNSYRSWASSEETRLHSSWWAGTGNWPQLMPGASERSWPELGGQTLDLRSKEETTFTKVIVREILTYFMF